jgi:Uma2 family endonuclease
MDTKPLNYLVPPETRMVLENIAWGTYAALSEQRHGSVPRMTYDEGVLEMMSPMREHENIGCLIGRIVEAYSEVRGIEIISVASMTVKCASLAKGFEPDESYYVTHAAQVLSQTEMDFEVDPPPDLVVEIEMTSSAIEKLKFFAAMNVPEVWRHNGELLRMYRLENAEYREIDCSVELPGLDAQRINEIVLRRNSVGETKLIREFRTSISG